MFSDSYFENDISFKIFEICERNECSLITKFVENLKVMAAKNKW